MATESLRNPNRHRNVGTIRCCHGELDGACRVYRCDHYACEHGEHRRCFACRRANRATKQVPVAPTASKKDQHRARFRAEPVVCVWGKP